MLDLRGTLPTFATITGGSFADVCWLDPVPIEPGSYLVRDRGYIDFRRLRRIAQGGAFFVIRERPDVKYSTAASRAVNRTTVLRRDQVIRFNGTVASRLWPERMRRVSISDSTHQRHLAFWTNLGELPAWVMAELYRQRWQIGTVLPLDQGKPAPALVLWHFAQRRARANLDRNQRGPRPRDCAT